MRQKDLIFRVTRDSCYEGDPIQVILTKSRSKAMFSCLQIIQNSEENGLYEENPALETLSYCPSREEFLRKEIETTRGYYKDGPSIDNLKEISSFLNSFPYSRQGDFSGTISLKVSTKDVFLGPVSMEFPLLVSVSGNKPGISTVSFRGKRVCDWHADMHKVKSKKNSEYSIRSLIFNGQVGTDRNEKRMSHIFEEEISRRYSCLGNVFGSRSEEEMLLAYSSLGISPNDLERGSFKV